MSIEYTLDIQLTELGFPDILQPPETPASETPCVLASQYASMSGRDSPTRLPKHCGKRRRLKKGRSVDPDGESTGGAQNGCAQQAMNPPGSTPAQEPPDKLAGVSEGIGDSLLPNPSSDGVVVPTGAPTPDAGGVERAGEDKDVKENVDDEQDAAADPAGASQEVEIESESSGDSEVSEVEEEEEEGLEEEDEEEEEDEGQGPGDSNGSEDYRCSLCDLLLSSNVQLQEHMNLHTGVRPHCCVECGKRFCQISNYRAHLRTHAQAKGRPPNCRICCKVFKSKSELKTHLAHTHFEKEFYECDLCKRVFADLAVCQRHVEWHKRTLGDFVCQTCGRIFSHQKSLTRHRAKKCLRSFLCTDCKRSFSSKNALLKHSFSHIGLLPYTCLRCRCHFRLAKLYRQHKCEPQRINCVACLRVFLSQEDFQKHKKDTGCWGHQDAKGDEIRCPECGENFATMEELKKHGGAHQRVLTCAVCGKGFRSALLLMSHMGGHAGQTPCLCQSCGLGFPHQQDYDGHLKNCGRTPPPLTKKTPKTSKTVNPAPQVVSKLPISPNTDRNRKNPENTISIPSSSKDKSGSTDLASAGQGPWRLTLDKPPPPGTNLVLFVTANSSIASGLVVAPQIPPTPPAPVTQARPRLTLPPSLKTEPDIGLHKGVSYLDGSRFLGPQVKLDVPLDLVMGKTLGPGYVAPLDLSKKTTSFGSATSIGPVKAEPEDPEFSDGARGVMGETSLGVDYKVKVKEGLSKKCSAALKQEPHTVHPSLRDVKATAHDLVVDIKKEPLSPGPSIDTLQSESRWT